MDISWALSFWYNHLKEDYAMRGYSCKCPYCGASVRYTRRDEVIICEYCGSTFEKPPADKYELTLMVILGIAMLIALVAMMAIAK